MSKMFKFNIINIFFITIIGLSLCATPKVAIVNTPNFMDESIDNRIGLNCTEALTHNIGTCQLVTKCPDILNKIKKGQVNHTVCGYQKLEQIVCCPKINTNMGHETTKNCFDPINQSKFMEVVGENCKDETSGKNGKYRWITQCPVLTVISSLKYSCCIPVVCCPEFKTIPTSIHEQKCRSYGRSLYEGKWEIKGPYTQKQEGNCPSYIFGGTIVSQGEFPFIAALGFRSPNGGYNYNCGGTLISEKYILTAAHCLSSLDLGPVVTVRLGAISLSETAFNNIYFKDYSVIERIPHPEYTIRSSYNDIALLKLDTNVQFTPYIRPACLPSSNKITEHVTAMGWGITEFGNKSQDLLKVNVDIFPHDQCNNSYPINRKLHLGIVDLTQVCAGSNNPNKDTCQGDSGGPLVSKHTKYYEIYNLIGITSIGRACGFAGIPGVYTRVFSYINWINSVVWPKNI